MAIPSANQRRDPDFTTDPQQGYALSNLPALLSGSELTQLRDNYVYGSASLMSLSEHALIGPNLVVSEVQRSFSMSIIPIDQLTFLVQQHSAMLL